MAKDKAAKEIRFSVAMTAVVDLLLGIGLMFMPENATSFVMKLISAGIALYGVFNILSFVFSKRTMAYTLKLIAGICAAAFGIFSFINPSFLPNVLFIVFGLMIAVGSLSGIRRAWTLKGLGFDRWYLPLISAIVTLAFGASIILYPKLYGNLLVVVIGVVMIAEALSDLFAIYRLSKLVRA